MPILLLSQKAFWMSASPCQWRLASGIETAWLPEAETETPVRATAGFIQKVAARGIEKER
jgi:hypothetical protein